LNFWFLMFSNENTYTCPYFSAASFIPFTIVSLWSLPFFFVFDSVTAFFSDMSTKSSPSLQILITRNNSNKGITRETKRKPCLFLFDFGIMNLFCSQLQLLWLAACRVLGLWLETPFIYLLYSGWALRI